MRSSLTIFDIAQEITMTTFQQRSWWARLTERLANLVTRLL